MHEEDTVYILSLSLSHTHTRIYTHNGILLSHKKNQMPFAATWMDLEMLVILSEVSQTEKDEYYISFICGI